MKTILLLLTLILTLGLGSCESEFQRRMKVAQELVQEEMMLRNSIELQHTLTPRSINHLVKIKSDIDFHAHLSGNKEVFLEELNSYKTKVAGSINRNQILITKYP